MDEVADLLHQSRDGRPAFRKSAVVGMYGCRSNLFVQARLRELIYDEVPAVRQAAQDVLDGCDPSAAVIAQVLGERFGAVA